MANRPGLIKQIWQGIRKGFYVYRAPERFVGGDHLGNRYFEIKEDPVNDIQGRRFVKGPTDDQFEVPNMPHEWNAWMTKNREDPPCQEELDRNHAVAMHKRVKGQELENQFEEEARQGAAEGLIHRMKKDKAKDRDYPTYNEYEDFPGDDKPSGDRR